jgi:hypothetical protein
MALMPRYLFQFASRGGEQIPDPDGVELEDLRAAHDHAMKLIRRTALFTCRRWNAREWSVQVVDIERRATVLTVLFPLRNTIGAFALSLPMSRCAMPLIGSAAAAIKPSDRDA